MILINFGHPFTDEQRNEIEKQTGTPLDQEISLQTQFDHMNSFADQAQLLVDQAGLSPKLWQTEQILVNPPTLHTIALVVLAELQGRMGYFPAIVRLRPVANTTPQKFEVAEIINLQKVRDDARTLR